MKIIDWNPGYYPDLSMADDSQKECYSKIVKKIEKGEYVEVGEKTSYLHCYILSLKRSTYDAVVSKTLPELESKCRNFIGLYMEAQPKVVSYIDFWLVILDCLQNKDPDTIIESLNRHIDFRVEHNLKVDKERSTVIFLHSKQVSPKTKVDSSYFVHLAPMNIKSLLTGTGKKYYDEICEYIKLILDADYDRTGINFLYKVYDFVDGYISIEMGEAFCMHDEDKEEEPQRKEYVFIKKVGTLEEILGTVLSKSYVAPAKSVKIKELKIPNRILSIEHKTFIKTLVKEAENAFRNDHNLKPIGEGWVSETILFKQIKAALPGIRVLQHSRPSFLGQQHYDVYIPKYKVAFEYQGDQHYKAIGLFGGEDGLANTQQRDQRKKELSFENGVVLCEVLPDYEVEEVIDALYEVITKHYPNATLLDWSDAVAAAKNALKETNANSDLTNITDEISNQVGRERNTDKQIDDKMKELLDSMKKSKFAGKETTVVPGVYSEESIARSAALANEFLAIQKRTMRYPQETVARLIDLMGRGYVQAYAYLELAKAYRRLKKTKSELFVLLQGKKDYNYDFDERIKTLIRRLDDRFIDSR